MVVQVALEALEVRKDNQMQLQARLAQGMEVPAGMDIHIESHQLYHNLLEGQEVQTAAQAKA